MTILSRFLSTLRQSTALGAGIHQLIDSGEPACDIFWPTLKLLQPLTESPLQNHAELCLEDDTAE